MAGRLTRAAILPSPKPDYDLGRLLNSPRWQTARDSLSDSPWSDVRNHLGSGSGTRRFRRDRWTVSVKVTSDQDEVRVTIGQLYVPKRDRNGLRSGIGPLIQCLAEGLRARLQASGRAAMRVRLIARAVTNPELSRRLKKAGATRSVSSVQLIRAAGLAFFITFAVLDHSVFAWLIALWIASLLRFGATYTFQSTITQTPSPA